jgi:hypothetical protein
MRIRSQLGRGTIVLLRLPTQGWTSEAETENARIAAIPFPRGTLRGPNGAQELDDLLTRRAVG